MKLWQWLTDLLRLPCCSHCGSLRVEHGTGCWNRAYNDLCKQAAGASGYYCHSCSKITWDEPDFEKWLEAEPDWIISYAELKRREEAENASI